MVFHSVGIERAIVDKNPYEKNIRKALNLGHTTTHAFESFAISRGTPVLHGYTALFLSSRNDSTQHKC
ncbi:MULTISPECIES: 3-dehydroquinate synthase family protein [unclassified Proteiniphilum]|uniref:3-dehydroquinate synthase family protein n=2 Tax=Proteiniphilum TaxID=294702 RepID=UPI0039C99AA4